MQRIKNDIKTGVFSKIYLMYGPETYLIDYYAKQIIEKSTDAETRDFNLLKISAEIPEEKAVDEFISSYPFMSDRKILYIRNSGIFKKASESQKKFWCGTLADLPDYITVIFAENDVDKRSSIYKQILKANCTHESSYMDEKALMQWVSKILASGGLRITVQDASYLVEICGPSMNNIKNELDKLAAYKTGGSVIERNDIELVTVKNVENRVFDMLNDVIAKRSEAAFEKLNALKTLNEEPIKIISIIFKKFSTYKKLYSLRGRPIKEICRLCGLYEKYAKNDINTLSTLSESKVDDIMNTCMETDFGIKSGKIDKWLAVDIVMAKITE